MLNWDCYIKQLLPGSLWPGAVAPERVLSMGQWEQIECQKWLMLNWDCYIKPFNFVQTRAQAHLRMLSTNYIYIYIYTGSLSQWVECSPMIRETWVQSQVASYQRLKKWYMIPSCLTLSNIRYVSRVKWSNPGKGLTPSPTPRCSSYWKGSLLVALDQGRELYYFIYIYIYI